jgi:hypothetical protein
MHELSKRFGNLIGGATDVKNHRYFSKIDFTAIRNMAYKDVPFLPPKGLVKLEDLINRTGLKLDQIPESQNEKAGLIKEGEDIFKAWF